MSLTLTVVDPPGSDPKEIVVTKTPFRIGRRPKNDLVCEHVSVSGKHAQFEKVGEQYFLYDLDSSNGTVLNGVTVRGNTAVPVKSGDKLLFGQVEARCAIATPFDNDPTLAAAQELQQTMLGLLDFAAAERSDVLLAALEIAKRKLVDQPPVAAASAAELPVPEVAASTPAPPPVAPPPPPVAPPPPPVAPIPSANALPEPTLDTVPMPSASTALPEPEQDLKPSAPAAPAAPDALAITGEDPDAVASELAKALRAGGSAEDLSAGVLRVAPGQRLTLMGLLEEYLQGVDLSVLVIFGAERARQNAIHEASFAALASISATAAGHEVLDGEAQVRRLGILVRQMLVLTAEWIHGSLQARKAFENEFSAKLTQFFALGMNPLKHALTHEQVGNYLLNPERDRDTNGIRGNLESAFRDLTGHQLALVAGVQTTLKSALEQLRPELHLEEAKKEGSWIANAVTLHARAWNSFQSSYKDLLENDTKLFNEVVYPNLRKAYLASHGEQGAGGDDA